jgi:hypothetical protein
MKKGVKEAVTYMQSMRGVIGSHLINPNSIYYGVCGHLRFARECGCALNDFDEEGQQEILHSSYSVIYVTGCNLKPLLNAKEWITEMSKQIKGE